MYLKQYYFEEKNGGEKTELGKNVFKAIIENNISKKVILKPQEVIFYIKSFSKTSERAENFTVRFLISPQNKIDGRNLKKSLKYYLKNNKY